MLAAVVLAASGLPFFVSAMETMNATMMIMTGTPKISEKRNELRHLVNMTEIC